MEFIIHACTGRNKKRTYRNKKTTIIKRRYNNESLCNTTSLLI